MGRPSDKALFNRVADRSTFQDAADGMTPALVHASATVQLTPNAVMGPCQKPNAAMFTNQF